MTVDVSDEGIEKFHAERGSTAPRVKLQDIENAIEQVIYFTAHDGVRGAKKPYTLPAGNKLDIHTFCVIILKNGWTSTGENALLSRENYDKEIAESLAYKQAMDKLWGHFAFHMRETFYKEQMM